MIFVPLLLVTAGTIAYLYWRHYQGEVAAVAINQSDLVVLLNNNVLSDFASFASDLQVLSNKQNEALHVALTGEDRNEALARLGLHFHSFLLQKGGIYDQVRLIDESGETILQIRWTPGNADQDMPPQIEAKEDTPSPDRAKKMEPGEVLAPEVGTRDDDGDAQQRSAPTIQFATPLLMGAETPRGAIVVDIKMDWLLQRLIAGSNLVKELSLARLNVASDISLLDVAGNRIIGPDPRDPSKLVFVRPGQPNSSFAQQFPRPWKRISSLTSEQFRYPAGMFTFHRLSAAPDQVLQPRDGANANADTTSTWKLVSHVHPDVFAVWRRQMIGGISRWSALVAILLFFGSWLFASETVDRQHSAAGMKRNEERFRQLAENIDEVFWIASADGEQLIYVSPAFQVIWGQSLSELYAHPHKWVDAIHPEDRARRAGAFGDVKEKGQFDIEYRVLRPDGETRWIRERGFAIRNEEGQVYRAAGIAGDTTALREAQEHVLRSERLAAVGEAMTCLAHESRNALQRSQAGLEMLGKRLQDRPESMELLTEVQKSQNYLHELYEEVRGYARPVTVRREPVDLGLILRETWEQLRQRRNGHPDRLIEEPTGISLECDVDVRSLGQVLRNILENAVAAADDPAEIRVHWSEMELDGRPALRVSIRDNGPGLTSEQRQHIFTPFFTTKTQGTGLGMAISKRIVDAHQGEIAVGPSAGRGADIVITLPRRIA